MGSSKRRCATDGVCLADAWDVTGAGRGFIQKLLAVFGGGAAVWTSENKWRWGVEGMAWRVGSA